MPRFKRSDVRNRLGSSDGVVIRKTWPPGSPRPYWTLQPNSEQIVCSKGNPPCTRTMMRVLAASAEGTTMAASKASDNNTCLKRFIIASS